MCYPGTIVDKGITGLQNQESTSSIVIKSREEFFFHLSRLSTSGKLEEAAHTTASWMYRSEERRVGKECRSRCSPYH